ncbi:ARM repeat-containing protein [Wallemia mellicola]|nr:ARM repeat-containing protein [Wallemia mellicola]
MSEVENLLQNAVSQNILQLQQATDELDRKLRQTDFLDLLHAYAISDADSSLRLSAIIVVKNNLIGFWRNIKSLQLSDNARFNIRKRSIEFFDVNDDKISSLNSIILSKIARIDYPRYWSTLIEDILARLDVDLALQDATHLTRLRRATYTLHLIVKEISAIRIANKAFPGLYATLFNYMLNLYQLAFTNLNRNLDWIHIAIYSHKTLSRLCLHNFNRSSDEELANSASFTQLTISHLPHVLEYKSNSDITILVKLINSFTKHLKLLQSTNQRKFSSIPNVELIIPLLFSQITSSPYTPSPPKYIIHILLILKLTLADWTPNNVNKDNPNAVISDEYAVQIVHFLIANYIPLTSQDLERWDSAPEDWVYEDDLDQWEIDPRPCAENLIVGTLIKRREAVGARICTMLQEASSLEATSTNLIMKESVYRIVGKCAEYLYDQIGFEEWLDKSLIPEVQISGSDQRILRRRIAVVLGRFSGESLSPEAFTKIYTILLHCLRPTEVANDVAVQVTAAITLSGVVDTWEFNPTLFEPFLNDIMPELIRILSACEMVEVKLRVLKSVTCIIDQWVLLCIWDIQLTRTQAIHYGPRLLELVPGLWDDSEGDWHFRGGILSMLSRLVAALQEGSNRALGIVVPLIKSALDPSQGKPFIDVDGIELWQTTLKHTPGLDESLVSLLPLALEAFKNDLDLANDVAPVIESYIYLSPELVLSQFSPALFSAINETLDYAQDRLRDQIIDILNLVTIAGSPSSWANALNDTGLFRDLFVKLIENKESPVYLSKFILFFSRICIVDTEMFVQLVRMSAASLNVPEEVALGYLLDRWWDKWDNLVDNYERKLSASGLARLVASGHQTVLERLPGEISNVFIDVLAEIKERRMESEEGGNPVVNITPNPMLNEVGDEGTAEKTRKLAIYSNDPLSSFTLPQFISHSLAHAQQTFSGGPDAFNERYFMQADQAVTTQLVKYMNETL